MANEVITIENLSEFKTKYDQKVANDISGLMAERKLTIEDGKITEYDGTPFAGQGGGGESDIVVFNDSNLPTSTELDEAIAANKAICVIYDGRDYMFDRKTGTTYYFYGADACSSYLYALTYNGTNWDRTQQVLAKQSWVNSQGFAKASDIPSLEGYATETWVQDQGYLTEHQSLDGYATETWVENKNYLVSDDIIGKADKTELTGYYPITGGNLSGSLRARGTGGTTMQDISPIYAEVTNANNTSRIGVGTNGSIMAGDYNNIYSHTIGVRRKIGDKRMAGRFQLYADGAVSFQQIENNGTADSIVCQLQYGNTTNGFNWGTMTYGSTVKHIAFTEDLSVPVIGTIEV